VALLTLVLLLAGVAPTYAEEYPSSVVGTHYDFIRNSDPSTFLCLEFKGRGWREMPDKTGPTPLFQEAFIFVAYFTDGTSVDVALDVDFETRYEARTEAMRYAPRLGRLPTSLRRGVERVVVHRGETNATAFSDVGLIVLYSDNATRRIETHDLEETLFHESVHAAWDERHARSPAWREAQASDGTFVTRYARENPVGEDLAESALFAYTLLHHPGRIPARAAERIRGAIPARIAFVEALLPPGEPIFQQVGPRYACDGSGTTFTVTPPADDWLASLDAEEENGTGACDIDITKVGQLRDILSNALMHGLHQEESVVAPFLARAKAECTTADELLLATMAEFGFDRSTVEAQVQAFLHCNCGHGDLLDRPSEGAGVGQAADGGEGAAEAGGVPRISDDGEASLERALYLIAGLLLGLLVVNAALLVVLLKRGSRPPS
jgi:hypothetical protein